MLSYPPAYPLNAAAMGLPTAAKNKERTLGED
jgi:hypothetical protein